MNVWVCLGCCVTIIIMQALTFMLVTMGIVYPLRYLTTAVRRGFNSVYRLLKKFRPVTRKESVRRAASISITESKERVKRGC